MQKLRIALASLVTTVWLVGYGLSFAQADTEAPQEITGLMVIVLGWAFAGQVREVIQKRVHEATRPDSNPADREDPDV